MPTHGLDGADGAVRAVVRVRVPLVSRVLAVLPVYPRDRVLLQDVGRGNVLSRDG